MVAGRARDLHGERQAIGAQPALEHVDRALRSRRSVAVRAGAPPCGRTDRASVPRRPLSFASIDSSLPHPCAVGALDGHAGDLVGLDPERRREVIAQPVVALELPPRPARSNSLSVYRRATSYSSLMARSLKWLRATASVSSRAAGFARLGLAYALDQRPVALRQRRVLVGGEVLDAARDGGVEVGAITRSLPTAVSAASPPARTLPRVVNTRAAPSRTRAGWRPPRRRSARSRGAAPPA